jgi:hypothetical protein
MEELVFVWSLVVSLGSARLFSSWAVSDVSNWQWRRRTKQVDVILQPYQHRFACHEWRLTDWLWTR